jgi:serine/threonine-protein phosphatase 6 regulatory ankyrin repeat subunit B
MVRALLARRADVNIKNNSGQTPLFIAAAQGNAQVVHALIKKGADVNIQNNEGQTPLFIARRQHGNQEVVTIL